MVSKIVNALGERTQTHFIKEIYLDIIYILKDVISAGRDNLNED